MDFLYHGPAPGTVTQVYSLSRLGVTSSSFFFKINLFIYLFLFLAALVPHCCPWAFSSCGERGLLSVAVRGLLIVVASLVAEHKL